MRGSPRRRATGSRGRPAAASRRCSGEPASVATVQEDPAAQGVRELQHPHVGPAEALGEVHDHHG